MVARDRNLHVFAGAGRKDEQGWRNQAYYLAPTGERAAYNKVHVSDDEAHRPVWRSHHISRAAENQRWVAAVNVAHPAQGRPSMLLDPTGVVGDEMVSDQAGLMRTESSGTNWTPR